MTLKIKLLSVICFLLALVSAPAAVFTYPPGSGSGGGAGSVISNQTSAAVIATFYTNTTPHYILGEARLGVSTIGTLQCSVTNSDNTLYFQYQAEQLSVGATSNTISFTVPPGGWYKFIGLTATATDGSQKLVYFATNGAVTFAASAGAAATATTATSSTNLVGQVFLIHNGTWQGGYTPRSAKANATAGDTIWVAGGIWNTNDMLKNGVNVHFQDAKFWYAPTDANPWGILDDRQLSGGYTGKITGNLDILWEHSTNNVSVVEGGAAVCITNPATYATIELNDVAGESYTTEISDTFGYPTLILVNNCRYVKVKLGRLTALRYSANDEFGNAPLICGFIWRLGECYFESDYIGIFPSYALWQDEPSDNTANQNFWITGKSCDGYIYASCTHTNYRVWYDFIEIKGSLYGAEQTAFGLFGGSHYITANKISSNSTNIVNPPADAIIHGNSSAEIWVNAEKLSAYGNTKGFLKADTSSIIHAKVQHYEWYSTNKVDGAFYNDTGYLDIQGGILTNCTAIGVRHISGTTMLNGVTIDTMSSTNPAVFVAGAGCSVKYSTLVSAATTNTISAGSAQTVATQFSAGNVAKNSNVTLGGEGTFTISSSIR